MSRESTPGELKAGIAIMSIIGSAAMFAAGVIASPAIHEVFDKGLAFAEQTASIGTEAAVAGGIFALGSVAIAHAVNFARHLGTR